MNEKLQYTRIYSNFKHRNKLWPKDKFDDDSLDDGADYSYLCGGNNMLNYLCLSCLNHELNHKERADRHHTDNQDYNDFYNNRLGARGRWFESSHPDTNRKH